MFNFHHVGYIVENLQDSIKRFEILGYTSSKIYIDNIQNIKIVLLENHDSPIIELILPIGEGNPLNRFLGENSSTKPYHIAFTVEDINESIDFLRINGFIATTKVAPSVAFDNKPFIFFYSQSTGLIELIGS